MTGRGGRAAAKSGERLWEMLHAVPAPDEAATAEARARQDRMTKPLGSLGISALTAAFTGRDPSEVTGHGTGIDERTYARKLGVVRRALARHRPDPTDPVGTLAAVGGLEHAALAGCLIASAGRARPSSSTA